MHFALSHRRWAMAAFSLVAASVAETPNAQASPLAYDGFDYPTGPLVSDTSAPSGPPYYGDNGGSGFSTPWYIDANYNQYATLVESQGLTYTDAHGNVLQTTGGRANNEYNYSLRGLSTSVNTNSGAGSLWFSFLAQEPNYDTNGFQYNGIQLYNAAAGIYGAGIYAGDRFGSNDIGYGNTSAAAGSSASSLTYVVGRLDFLPGNKMQELLFINPNLDSTPDDSTAAISETHDSVGTLDSLLIQGNGNGRNGVDDGLLDEIRLGTTYADVAPVAVATPEPASGLALAAMATIALRRRRATC